MSFINKQTISRNRYQVIVVDDASSDGTGEYLSSLDNIVYHRNELNKGRAVTRNTGIKKAKSELIILIDDDIWADEKLIEEHIKTHQKSKPCEVAVVGAVLVSPEVPQTAMNEYQNKKHEWCHKEMRLKQDDLPFNFCKTANLSLPKSMFLKVGLFNESFIGYGGEDTDLGYRLMNKGVKMIFSPLAVGYHYHDDTVDAMLGKEKERVRSIGTFYSLHPEWESTEGGFFTHHFHKTNNIKSLIYNIAKSAIFSTPARALNRLFVNRFGNKIYLKYYMIKYFLPVLKIQYLRYYESLLKNENRD